MCVCVCVCVCVWRVGSWEVCVSGDVCVYGMCVCMGCVCVWDVCVYGMCVIVFMVYARVCYYISAFTGLSASMGLVSVIM